jgi:hypothetical protein
MAFAPSNTYFDVGDGSIVGSFLEKDTGNLFEFSKNTDDVMAEWPHKVWVTTPRPGIDSGYRYAMVKKTCLYIVTDEDEHGRPVVDKWYSKQYNVYPFPEVV